MNTRGAKYLLKTPCGESPRPPFWNSAIRGRDLLPEPSKLYEFWVRNRCLRAQNGGPGEHFGTPGWCWEKERETWGPEGSLLGAFFMILGAFLETKFDEKSCFFRTLIFSSKIMNFRGMHSLCSVFMVFERSGSIWEVPRTGKNWKKCSREHHKCA